jgi:hypothetical protein
MHAIRRHRKNETEIWGEKLFTSYTHPVSWLIRQVSETKNSATLAQEKRAFLGDKNFSFSGIFS